ncbi:MAG: hypothetical protein IMZ62_09245 [Chloroflexi bacterium]|nr:hypothetical protein [Chloroflexota bacterium]
MDWGTLSAGQTIGQTFVAKYDGLAGIYFYLSPQKTGNGEIRLHLRSAPQAADDLAVSLNTLAVDALKAPGYYGFFVPAQASSNQKYYYAFLEVTGSGDIQVGKAAGDAYLNGALYQNGTPEDAQAAFQLSYSRRKSILGLGWEAVTWGGILAVGFFLFILPGWGLFSLLWPGWGGIKWPEKLGLSAGLSLALYPLLLLWTDIIGLHLGAIYAWLPPLAGLGIILWRNRKRLSVRTFPRANALMLPWADVAFIGIVALIVLTRFWAIRSLDVPMWGDSYQHTMIAQLLVDHGGLFTSWQPYAELTTFTYHFGFHSAAAVFDWITRQDMSKAVLWVGQLLNVLAVIVLYPLATKVGRSQWAGVVAVLVAGLLLPMPMFYVNWGRYTQLAGQVIFPVAVWVIWNTLISSPLSSPKGAPKVRGESKGMVTIGCIVLGGLAVTHYRVLIFAVIFLATLLILYARRETIRPMLLKTFWVGAGAGLLFLPWFIRVFGGRILQLFASQMTTSAARAVEFNPQLTGTGNIFVYLPSILWLALPVVIGCGIWRREKGLVLISLWWYANLLAANPYWLGLPGAGVLDSFTVFIAAYIPAGIIVGAAASWLDDRKNTAPGSQSKIHNAFSLGAVILLIGAGFWGARQRLNDVQPSKFALATRPDILAAMWIQENTAPEARLLVNSFPAFSNSVIVGSDGGWWLPLLAGRQINVPPINYGTEQGSDPDYLRRVNALSAEINAKSVIHPDVINLLRARGITYVYIGQQQGRVNYGGPAVFDPQQMLGDAHFRLVYHQDRVWVFEVMSEDIP